MIIYNIVINDTNQGLLFDNQGDCIETYSQHFDAHNGFSTVVYKYKKQRVNMFSEQIETKTVKFHDLPEEIKGLISLYNYDILTVKKLMAKKEWNKFLALHFK